MGNAKDAVLDAQAHLHLAGEAVYADGTDVERDGVVAGMLLVGGGNGEDEVVEGREGEGRGRVPPKLKFSRRHLQHPT